MVSIIIPTFNRLQTLLATIESIRRQKPADYEIIVVDDCSTDSTAAEIRARYGSSVKLVSTDRRLGPSYARNTGLSKASGEYVWFLDSDVVLPDESLMQRMVSTFESDPGIGSLGGEIVVHEDTPERAYGRRIRWNATNERVTAYKGSCLVECDYLATCNCFTRRKYVTELNGFDERFVFGAEDMDLGLRLRQKGLRNYVNHALAVLHYHEKKGRYKNETTHYQRTRVQFIKKHFVTTSLAFVFAADFLKFLRFYFELPAKLLLMLLSGRKIERQNIFGGWYGIKYYFASDKMAAE